MASATNIITEVRRVIHDESAASFRWSDAELIDYLNAGVRQTVVLVPESNTVEAIVDTLTSRIAKQVLPAGGIKFIKVSRNYADDGSTPQGVVRFVEKDALDTYEPNWEFSSIKTDVANYFEHFCHDSREPKVFYLYPAPSADNKRVSIVYSSSPAALSQLVDPFPLADEYINAITLYIIYRAMTKESRQTIPGALRQELWNNYLAALGLKKQAEQEISPEQNRAPEGD